ncbi:hypothetical protein E5D57_003770 [Metarhizium anisopliae]|nr:hypothetical protein E5D57_003770 [Metarhizium anisopliae]
MATSAEKPSKTGDVVASHSAPRKFKASDLPLSSATRAAIESLKHSFKKGGAYDSIRKQVWDKFGASDCETIVKQAILEVAEKEVDRNPQQLLTLDPRKASALIDGALERSGVYQKAEGVIAKLIDVDAIEERIREIRRAEIGEEAAESERIRGAKTDEERNVNEFVKNYASKRPPSKKRSVALSRRNRKRRSANGHKLN